MDIRFNYFIIFIFILSIIIFVKIFHKIDNIFKVLTNKIKQKNKKIIFIVDFIRSFVIVIPMVLLFKSIIGNIFIAEVNTMEETIHKNEIIISDVLSYKFRIPKREEIIVMKNEFFFIKRVMGLPGETIQIKEDHLFVNDELIHTRYYKTIHGEKWIVPKKYDKVTIILKKNYKHKYLNIYQMSNDIDFYVNDKKTGKIMDLLTKCRLKELSKKGKIELILKNDYYYLLEDNQNGKIYDSREFGFVNEEQIKGRIFLRIFPFNKISFI